MMIETERLVLRPFLESDAEDVYEYLHKPAVNCFECMRLDTIEDAKAEMKKRVGETEYYFAIVLKESNKVIGEIDAFPESGEPHQDGNAVKDTFSPCWMLNLNFTCKGYAFEAAHAFFDYLFKEKGARRIYAYTEDYNKSSQRLCEKLGMRQEGLFKEFISFINNPDGTPRYENTYQYAILKKEWEKGDFTMNVTYEKKEALTFIGFHTEILPEEGYQKCPEFWDKEYAAKYARLWQTMKPETPTETAILENGIGMYAICADSKGSFTYWIAGLYKGGNVPEGLELYTFPAGKWAMFSAKGALPNSLQSLNTEVWQKWLPTEGKKLGADGKSSVEVYSAGNPQSPDYECGIWVPIKD